jgi:hypothetical protein
MLIVGAVLWWLRLYTVDGPPDAPKILGGLACLVAKPALCQMRDHAVALQGYIPYQPAVFWLGAVLGLAAEVAWYRTQPLLPVPPSRWRKIQAWLYQ